MNATFNAEQVGEHVDESQNEITSVGERWEGDGENLSNKAGYYQRRSFWKTDRDLSWDVDFYWSYRWKYASR